LLFKKIVYNCTNKLVKEMEKKVEVFTARGFKVRVPANMLRDVARFDAFPVKKTAKEAPREILKIAQPVQQVIDNLPPMESSQEPVIEKPPRKAPVRSKAK
jgi:hypothetical protein